MHVIFGIGPVGWSTMEALRERGERVRVVSRRVPEHLPQGIQHIAADALDAAAVATACKGATVVYQCLNAPYHRWATLFPPLQRAVVKGAQQAGARFVSFENVYMYGLPDQGHVNEASPHAPCSQKGETRSQMAQSLGDLHQSGALKVAQVRASDLFGPGMRYSALGDEIFARAVAGKTPRGIGGLSHAHTWTYTVDAGKTLARVGTDPHAFGQVWHVPSAKARTLAQVCQSVGEQINRPIKPGLTPAWMLRMIGLFVPPAGAMVEMLYQFDRDYIVDDAATRAELGIVHTPFDQALSRTLDWFKNPGALPTKDHSLAS